MAHQKETLGRLIAKTKELLAVAGEHHDVMLLLKDKWACTEPDDLETFEDVYLKFSENFAPRRKTLLKYPVMLKQYMMSFYSFLERIGKLGAEN